MIAWLFIVAGWSLLAVGAWVALWWGWRDIGKGTRRCPKCWYDMSATAGLKCPECGREANGERKLFRKHRKWRWVFAGLVIVAASYPVFKWPLYQKNGVIGFVPRTLTIAFAPELSEAWDRWKARGSRPGLFFVDDIVKVQPLDRAERSALAWMIGRVLRDPVKLRRHGGILVMISLPRLGEQAGSIAHDLAVALAGPQQASNYLLACERLPLIWDVRMKELVGPAIDAVLSGRGTPSQAEVLLDRLQAWGASDEKLRETAFYLIEHPRNGSTADSGAMAFLWRENLVRAADRERLLGYLRIRVWPFAEYAAYCAAELGTDVAVIVPSLREDMKQSDLQAIPDWTCLAMGMGEASEPLLPALDRFAKFKKYPTFKVCGEVGALSIRGFDSEAYDLWLAYIEQSDNTNAATAPQRYQISPLVMFLKIQASKKAEGLVRVLQAEAPSATPSSVSGNLIFAIDALGKLGADASDAVPAMIELINPNVMSYLVERSLRSIQKIRPLHPDELEALELRVHAWMPTSGASTAVEAQLDRLRRASSDRLR